MLLLLLVLNYKHVSDLLLWIGLFTNVSICLSAALGSEHIEMRIKHTEFHLVPTEGSKVLAAAYGERWIRSKPGQSAQHEKATEMCKAFVTKNISEGKRHFLIYKHEIVLNLWHWKSIIYSHVLSKGKTSKHCGSEASEAICKRENLQKWGCIMHLGGRSNTRKPLFLKPHLIKCMSQVFCLAFFFFQLSNFWVIPEYLTIWYSSIKCEVIFFKYVTLR